MEVLFEVAIVFILFTLVFSIGLLDVCYGSATVSNLAFTSRLACIAGMEAERIAGQLPPQLRVMVNSSIKLYERVEEYRYRLNSYSLVRLWETEETRYLLGSGVLSVEAVKLIYVNGCIVRIHVIVFGG